MSHLTAFETEDLKLVYRVLHGRLMEHPELMDSAFLNELQLWLQTLAKLEKVDLSDHSEWDRWLGNVPAGCEDRVQNRRSIEPR